MAKKYPITFEGFFLPNFCERISDIFNNELVGGMTYVQPAKVPSPWKESQYRAAARSAFIYKDVADRLPSEAYTTAIETLKKYPLPALPGYPPVTKIYAWEDLFKKTKKGFDPAPAFAAYRQEILQKGLPQQDLITALTALEALWNYSRLVNLERLRNNPPRKSHAAEVAWETRRVVLAACRMMFRLQFSKRLSRNQEFEKHRRQKSIIAKADRDHAIKILMKVNRWWKLTIRNAISRVQDHWKRDNLPARCSEEALGYTTLQPFLSALYKALKSLRGEPMKSLDDACEHLMKEWQKNLPYSLRRLPSGSTLPSESICRQIINNLVKEGILEIKAQPTA